MMYQSVFQRYEIKYILTWEQARIIKEAISSRMTIDAYGPTTIRNIYFDTDDMRIIKTSLDQPDYKEKLRIRSYRSAGHDDPVFVELKKKYMGVVYKRRTEVISDLAMDWLAAGGDAPQDSQIAREITYFRDFYGCPAPKVFLSYLREAYVPRSGSDDLRITFDTEILGRETDLSFANGIYGRRILPEDKVLMEIKIPGVMPLWLSRLLSNLTIRKQSFSKYGAYYREYMKEPEKYGEMRKRLLYA